MWSKFGSNCVSMMVSPPGLDLTGIEIPDIIVPITGLKRWQIMKCNL